MDWGSLAEVGFSIVQAIKLDDRREFVVFVVFVVLVDSGVDEILKADFALAKESTRARALVKQHLKKLRLSNLYLVDTMEELLEISLKLYPAAEIRKLLVNFNPHNKKNYEN